MQKLIKFVIILLLLSGIVIGCSNQPDFQLQFNSYPKTISEGDSFTIEAQLATFNDQFEDVKVILSVRELSTDKELVSKTLELSNQDQTFSFSGINLENVSDNIYFELKLMKKGSFAIKINTRSQPTIVANLHTNIITTYFEDTDSDGNALYAAWDNKLTEENSYYCALPYKPGYDGKVYQEITDVKDRWVEVYYPKTEKYVYVQWEDVGPWNVYDPEYVFSANDVRPQAEEGHDTGWSGEVRETNGAGLDISPEAMDYLNGDGHIEVNWRFVSFEEVKENSTQDAPWLDNVSGSKSNTKLLNLEKEMPRTNTLGELQ